jgi:hypothetical protein
VKNILVGIIAFSSFCIFAIENNDNRFKGKCISDNPHFFYNQECVSKAVKRAIFKCEASGALDCRVVSTESRIKKLSLLGSIGSNYPAGHVRRICKAVVYGEG